jgi:hypothetical protein
MVHSGKFTALLDANVLYPAPLRDYLLQLASLDLYKPRWTEQIQNEWIDNLLLKRCDLTRQQLQRTKDAMNSAFPDANVTNYKELMEGLSLPDEDDKHVLAAAIRANTDVIVTVNLKDFPTDYLKKFDIESQHPDTFISNLINLDKQKAIEALNNQIKSLKNPPKTKKEVLETLKNCGLEQSVILLEE